jgi:hypothetical protein
MNNAQVHKMAIMEAIKIHIKENPHDTKDFILAITQGLSQFADTQRDMASMWFNDLSLLMEANPKAKDHKLRAFGEIAERVLPRWEGAPIHKEMVEKWQPRIDEYRKKHPKVEKPAEVDDFYKEQKVSKQFGFKE